MKTVLDHLRDFYSGKWYPLIVLALTVLGNSLGYEFACFLGMVASFFIGCLFAYDFRFALSPFMCTVFFVSPRHAQNVTEFREYYMQPLAVTVMVIGFGLIFVGTVLFAIRNRRRINSFPWKGLFLSLSIWCASLCFNGLFAPVYSVQNLLYAVTFPLMLLILYTLFALYVKFDQTAFDYFMYCLLIACSAICLELFARYLSGAVIVDGVIVKTNVVLGWGVWTTIGGMIAFLMPAAFYFVATKRYGWIFYGLGLVQFFCTVLSQSRGAMLFGGVILLICLSTLCFFGRNKRINRILTIGLIVIAGIGVLLLREKLMGLLQSFLDKGFDDSERFDLWKLGVQKFLSAPVFGAGFYDNGIVSTWDIQLYPFFYHNTAVQILASTGVVGVLAYLWHRFCTIRAVVRKPSLYKTYLGICILSCLLFCMLDVLLFITYPLIFYTLILLFIEKRDEAELAEQLYSNIE